jgi:hypothetical protein
MSRVKRYNCTNGGASFCQGCYTMTECELGDYVSSEDYDTLRTANQLLEGEVKRLASDLAFLAEYVLGREYGRPLPNYLAIGRYPIDVAEAALAGAGGE